MTPARYALLGIAVLGISAVPFLLAAAIPETPVPTATPAPLPSLNECPAAEFAPTYLPWAQGSVGKPQRFDAQDTFLLQWTSPRDYGDATASLTRRYRPWADNKDLSSVPVRGSKGRLVWIGEPGDGELTLQWSEGNKPCDHYGLFLFDPSLTQREAEDEIARIARSLR